MIREGCPWWPLVIGGQPPPTQVRWYQKDVLTHVGTRQDDGSYDWECVHPIAPERNAEPA